eukprot:GDKK01025905.1.p1 GENE.GDKK01025905.1~~GDKK01025905.1.p1  ORF type:complete len:1212 (-),score=348.85 GDKK01025905.1:1601-5236(-)
MFEVVLNCPTIWEAGNLSNRSLIAYVTVIDTASLEPEGHCVHHDFFTNVWSFKVPCNITDTHLVSVRVGRSLYNCAVPPQKDDPTCQFYSEIIIPGSVLHSMTNSESNSIRVDPGVYGGHIKGVYTCMDQALAFFNKFHVIIDNTECNSFLTLHVKRSGCILAQTTSSISRSVCASEPAAALSSSTQLMKDTQKNSSIDKKASTTSKKTLKVRNSPRVSENDAVPTSSASRVSSSVAVLKSSSSKKLPAPTPQTNLNSSVAASTLSASAATVKNKSPLPPRPSSSARSLPVASKSPAVARPSPVPTPRTKALGTPTVASSSSVNKLTSSSSTLVKGKTSPVSIRRKASTTPVPPPSASSSRTRPESAPVHPNSGSNHTHGSALGLLLRPPSARITSSPSSSAARKTIEASSASGISSNHHSKLPTHSKVAPHPVGAAKSTHPSVQLSSSTQLNREVQSLQNQMRFMKSLMIAFTSQLSEVSNCRLTRRLCRATAKRLEQSDSFINSNDAAAANFEEEGRAALDLTVDRWLLVDDEVSDEDLIDGEDVPIISAGSHSRFKPEDVESVLGSGDRTQLVAHSSQVPVGEDEEELDNRSQQVGNVFEESSYNATLESKTPFQEEQYNNSKIEAFINIEDEMKHSSCPRKEEVDRQHEALQEVHPSYSKDDESLPPSTAESSTFVDATNGMTNSSNFVSVSSQKETNSSEKHATSPSEKTETPAASVSHTHPPSQVKKTSAAESVVLVSSAFPPRFSNSASLSSVMTSTSRVIGTVNGQLITPRRSLFSSKDVLAVDAPHADRQSAANGGVQEGAGVLSAAKSSVSSISAELDSHVKFSSASHNASGYSVFTNNGHAEPAIMMRTLKSTSPPDGQRIGNEDHSRFSSSAGGGAEVLGDAREVIVKDFDVCLFENGDLEAIDQRFDEIIIDYDADESSNEIPFEVYDLNTNHHLVSAEGHSTVSSRRIEFITSSSLNESSARIVKISSIMEAEDSVQSTSTVVGGGNQSAALLDVPNPSGATLKAFTALNLVSSSSSSASCSLQSSVLLDDHGHQAIFASPSVVDQPPSQTSDSLHGQQAVVSSATSNPSCVSDVSLASENDRGVFEESHTQQAQKEYNYARVIKREVTNGNYAVFSAVQSSITHPCSGDVHNSNVLGSSPSPAPIAFGGTTTAYAASSSALDSPLVFKAVSPPPTATSPPPPVAVYVSVDGRVRRP